jgi:hypothetical protein
LDVIKHQFFARCRPVSLVPFMAIGAFLGAAGLVMAQTTPGAEFELDGNSACDTPSVNNVSCTGSTIDDWNLLNDSGGPNPTGSPGHSVARTFITEPKGGLIFTTGGSKDPLDLASWAWKSGAVPDKDLLTNGYAGLYTTLSGGVGGTPEQILEFGADRFAVNGDSNIGIWFFQQNVGPTPTPSATVTSGGFGPGVHQFNDIFVISAFTLGGTQPGISVFRWNAACLKAAKSPVATSDGGQANGFPPNGANNSCADANLELLFASNGVCTSTSAACAVVNHAGVVDQVDATGTITVSWPYAAKFGGSVNTIPAGGFYEGGINLTTLLGPNLPCFSSILFETRSSQSTSAVLKDFLAGHLISCSATTSTEIHTTPESIPSDVQNTTIPSGSTIFDKIFVMGEASTPMTSGTATFQFFTNGLCTTPAASSGTVTLTAAGGNLSGNSAPQGPLAAGSYSFLAQYNGDDPNYPKVVVNTCEHVNVSSPGISIGKTCGALLNGTGNGVTVTFSGQVCNTGSEPLKNIFITDAPTSGNILPQGGTLAISACFTYSGSYTSTTLANNDTATVNADSATGTGHVMDSHPASCTAPANPRIAATKTCTTHLVNNEIAGRLVVLDMVGGNVCNTGDVQVTLGTLTDTKAGDLFSSFVPPNPVLGPGQCATYSGTYHPTTLTPTNGGSTDTVTATGHGFFANEPVSDNHTANCDLCPLPNGAPD